MSKRTIYGYCNCAAFNLAPDGDEHWFSTRTARDAALAAKRAGSVAAGLSESAAVAGIYPIRAHRSDRIGVLLQDTDETIE